MLDDAAAERDKAERDRENEAHFMDDGTDQQPRGRGQHSDQHRARQAVDETQPRQADGQPIARSSSCRLREHDAVDSSCGAVLMRRAYSSNITFSEKLRLASCIGVAIPRILASQAPFPAPAPPSPPPAPR